MNILLWCILSSVTAIFFWVPRTRKINRKKKKQNVCSVKSWRIAEIGNTRKHVSGENDKQKHNLSLLQDSLNSTADYSRMAEYTWIKSTSKLRKVKIKSDIMCWKWETNIVSSSGFTKSNSVLPTKTNKDQLGEASNNSNTLLLIIPSNGGFGWGCSLNYGEAERRAAVSK